MKWPNEACFVLTIYKLKTDRLAATEDCSSKHLEKHVKGGCCRCPWAPDFRRPLTAKDLHPSNKNDAYIITVSLSNYL